MFIIAQSHPTSAPPSTTSSSSSSSPSPTSSSSSVPCSCAFSRDKHRDVLAALHGLATHPSITIKNKEDSCSSVDGSEVVEEGLGVDNALIESLSLSLSGELQSLSSLSLPLSSESESRAQPQPGMAIVQESASLPGSQSPPVPEAGSLVSVELSVLLWRDTHHEIPLQRPVELARTIHNHVMSLTN